MRSLGFTLGSLPGSLLGTLQGQPTQPNTQPTQRPVWNPSGSPSGHQPAAPSITPGMISSLMGRGGSSTQTAAPSLPGTSMPYTSNVGNRGLSISTPSWAKPITNFVNSTFGGGGSGPTMPNPPGTPPTQRPNTGNATPIKPSPPIELWPKPPAAGVSESFTQRPSPLTSLNQGHGFNPTLEQINNAGMPFAPPNYSSLLNEAGTNWATPELASLYGMSGTQYDPTAFNNYSNYATSTAASPWLNLMNQQIKTQGAQSVDQLNRARAGGLSTAMDTLASRGGMRTGAAENLQRSSLRDLMLGNQATGISTNEALNKAAITEQESKLEAMRQLPGMSIEKMRAQSELEKLKTGALTGERDKQYQAGLDAFQTLMTAWAANQHAQKL